MKIKEKQGYKRVFGIFAAPLVLLCALVAIALPIGATGELSENSFLDENYNMAEEYSALLSEESNLYSTLDTTADKAISKSVLNLINAYRKELLDVQSHPDADERLLTKEIKLAYVKGCAAGRLGWIYHYNLPRLSASASVAELQREYERFIGEINSATDPSVLSARADAIAAEANRTVYSLLIKELALEGDSLASSSLIAGGLSRVENIDSSDLFGEELARILEDTESALALQRSRDLLSDELREIFAIILPDSDYSSDKSVALFAYKLKNADSVEEMNSALQSTLESLLSVPEEQVYSHLFRARLKESVAAATLKASGEGRSAELSFLFDGFALLSAKADAKDEIRVILLGISGADEARLEQIESDFNGEGGFIDVSPQHALSCEILRASTVKQCYTALQAALEEIGIVLEPYEPAPFSKRAADRFENFLKSLYQLSAQAGFEQSCAKLLGECSKDILGILLEAKAERFLSDHKGIIQKGADELSADDEIALRHALRDYCELEAEVRGALGSQINSIAEKYNTVLSQIIRSRLIDDALYQDLCEEICKELRELSKNNIDEYYNNCDLILDKSETLASVVESYRIFSADELYESFNSSEREELILICREAAESICALDVGDKAIFGAELEDVLEDAKIKMNRTSQTVRIRLATRESDNAEIRAISAEAASKIKSCYDKAEMSAIADKAIFKINRLLTVDAISKYCDEGGYGVSKMEFLSSDEKDAALMKIEALEKELSEDARIAENLTVLGFIWESFCERIRSVYEGAEQTNLTRSREEHLSLLDKEVASLAEEIRAMAHLTKQKSEEYLNKAIQLQSTFGTKAVSLHSAEEIKSLYSETLESINSIRISASGENLKSYKLTVREQLLEFEKLSPNYSDENYNKILSIISDALTELESAGSISGCNALLAKTQELVDSVKDLLDEAKEDAINKLEALASTYRSQSELYSSSSISAIEQILAEGKRMISSFSEISDVPVLKEELEGRLASLRSVKKDYVTSSPIGLAFSTSKTEYPLQYQFSTGYWGLIYAPSSLSPDAKLSILPHTQSDLEEIEKLIRRAAKEGGVSYRGAPIDASQRELVSAGSVALAFDVTLNACEPLDFPVTLQMLLPSSLKEENLLGVAFVSESGEVEFYGVEQRDLLVSLQLERFSSYYIIAEGSISLLPLIILLGITVILEFLTLGILLFIRYRRRLRRKDDDSMLPMLSSYFISPIGVAAARIQPSGAVSASILLSVAALALGCGIALLLRAELKDSQKKRKQAPPKPQESPAEQRHERLRSAQRPMLKAKVYRLEAPKSEQRQSLPKQSEDGSDGVACAVSLKEREMIEGESLDFTMDFEDEDDGARKDRRRKCEVNLDVIERYFEAGELVTLEALKKKRIAPKKADYVKILARGALSKPLIIEAQDFSRAAEEMLRAVGGEAIRIKR